MTQTYTIRLLYPDGSIKIKAEGLMQETASALLNHYQEFFKDGYTISPKGTMTACNRITVQLLRVESAA